MRLYRLSPAVVHIVYLSRLQNPIPHEATYKAVSGCCRIDVVTKEDALDFLQVEENKQKTTE